MKCPFCRTDNDRVTESRSAEDGYAIRRRRECLGCKRRFTTYERAEQPALYVVKKDGRRAPFDRSRILNGIAKACEKRPVKAERFEEITLRIEQKIRQKFDREVPSRFIGEQVMKELKKLDPVAYVRFASVYREFKDLGDFVEQVKAIRKRS